LLVVVAAERLGLKRLRANFFEIPEKFVTIEGAGLITEKKFYEAIFLGSPFGSNDYRSSHVVDGKKFVKF